jgi:glycosyltransferase involved in cell wall biosynthesis
MSMPEADWPEREPGQAWPRVSVVIPAYNVAPFVAGSIHSALNQSLQPVEVVVVDDGSTDDTAAAVAAIEDPRVRLISQPNRGVSAARNAGLAVVQAPFVLFLDGDDLLTPDALAQMYAALERAPDRVAVIAQHEKITEAGRPFSASPPPPKPLPHADTLRHLLAGNFIVTGGAICIRTSDARAVGGFDANLRFGEDWEFWCRLALRGDFAVLPDLVSVQYRIRTAGANTQLRGSPLRPNFSVIDAVQSIPGLDRRLTRREQRRARRLAECDIFWGAARNEIASRNFGRFTRYLLVGLWRYPDSLFQPERIQRFVWSSLRMVAPR